MCVLKQSVVRDSIAMRNIRGFVRNLESEERIGTIQLMLRFNYPSEQIVRVMEKLEKEGVVKAE